jgi:hypothetical protein
MPVNYKETALAGTRWQRARLVLLQNPLVGQKGATFQEESAVMLDGNVQSLGDVASIFAPFDPSGEIPLLDPTTGEPTGGVATHAQLYQIVFSLYRQVAAARDADQFQLPLTP